MPARAKALAGIAAFGAQLVSEMEKPTWRITRTSAGEVLRASWVDASQDDETVRAKRVLAPRLYPRQPWEETPGLETQPFCHHCGSTMVWRGWWQCVGCAVRGGYLHDDGGVPRSLPREALAGVPIFSASEGDNSTPRASWLWSVESLTSMHRRSVAARLRHRGTRLAEAVNTDGVVEQRPYLSKWHEHRIDAQADRFERVAQCGTYEYALDVTDEHGKVTTRALKKKCDCWRVCQRCLNTRKWRLSEGMKTQRALALQRFKREAGRYYNGPERKWSEKLITFTVPHGDVGPSEDARVLVGAWQLMLRRIRGHLAQRGCVEILRDANTKPSRDAHNGGTAKTRTARPRARAVPWCRAVEVSERNGEHAHMHVWWFGPYLESALLQMWWGELIEAKRGKGSVPTLRWAEFLAGKRQAGHAPDKRLAEWLGFPADDKEMPWGIVDIRADKSATGLASTYAQKVGVSLYITKGSETLRMEPAHAAAVYEVFEGTRAVQWARGWAPPRVPLRAKCVTFRRLTDEEKSRLSRSALTVRKQEKSAEKTVQNVASTCVDVPVDTERVVDRDANASLLSRLAHATQLTLNINTI